MVKRMGLVFGVICSVLVTVGCQGTGAMPFQKQTVAARPVTSNYGVQQAAVRESAPASPIQQCSA